MSEDIVQSRNQGLAGALNNGLNDEQNQTLFRSADMPHIAELILTGLTQFS